MVLVSPRDYYLLPPFLVLAGNPLAGLITEDSPTLPWVLWNATMSGMGVQDPRVRLSGGAPDLSILVTVDACFQLC